MCNSHIRIEEDRNLTFIFLDRGGRCIIHGDLDKLHCKDSVVQLMDVHNKKWRLKIKLLANLPHKPSFLLCLKSRKDQDRLSQNLTRFFTR